MPTHLIIVISTKTWEGGGFGPYTAVIIKSTPLEAVRGRFACGVPAVAYFVLMLGNRRDYWLALVASLGLLEEAWKMGMGHRHGGVAGLQPRSGRAPIGYITSVQDFK